MSGTAPQPTRLAAGRDRSRSSTPSSHSSPINLASPPQSNRMEVRPSRVTTAGSPSAAPNLSQPGHIPLQSRQASSTSSPPGPHINRLQNRNMPAAAALAQGLPVRPSVGTYPTGSAPSHSPLSSGAVTPATRPQTPIRPNGGSSTPRQSLIPPTGALASTSVPVGARTSVSPSAAGGKESGLHGEGAEAGAGKVAAFLNKLFSMINDTQTDSLIYWAADGKSFFIPNSQEFGRQLLPQFFKHANFTSFVRQLNMYGFKKVPHLQAGALTSIPSSSKTPPNTQAAAELWEFSNPKFMRSRPELLASITRKRSAKEVAAAQALAGTMGEVKKEEPAEEMDVDLQEQDQRARQLGIPAGRNRQQESNNAMVDPQALNKALALMHSTHSAMEKQIADLKSSNEMLWRQALLSQKEQEKSQKRLEGVVNFLASKFGGMGVAGLLGGDDAGDSTGVGKLPGRMGRGRLIGDGITGLAGSDEEEGMDQDDLWEHGDPDEGKFWELDDKGNEVKKQIPRSTPVRPGTSRALTTPGRANFPSVHLPATPHQDPSHAQRFQNLETSPETDLVNSFDGQSDANMETQSPEGSFAADAHEVGNQLLFPPAGHASYAATPSPLGSTGDTGVSSAMTVHQSSNAVPYAPNNGSFVLDPSILQMPLGTLLSNPAGAQLLATLGNLGMSAQGVANTEQGDGSGGGNTVLGHTTGSGSSSMGFGLSPKMSEFFDLQAAEEDGLASGEASAETSHEPSPELTSLYGNGTDWPVDQIDVVNSGGLSSGYGLNPDAALGMDGTQPAWTTEEMADFLALMGGDNEGNPYRPEEFTQPTSHPDLLNGGTMGSNDPLALDPILGQISGDMLGVDSDVVPPPGPVAAVPNDAVEGMPGQIRKKRKTDQR